MNPNHPIFVPLPDGRNGINTQDGVIPVTPVNIQASMEMTTAIMTPGGPIIMPIHDALAIQTTLAGHWLRRFEEIKEQLANARAQLNEAHGEGQVYELPADIHVTAEEFGELKHMQKVLHNYFGIDSVDGIERLYNDLDEARKVGQIATFKLPDEITVALRKLGVTTVGGLRAFLEHHNLHREAQLVDG